MLAGPSPLEVERLREEKRLLKELVAKQKLSSKASTPSWRSGPMSRRSRGQRIVCCIRRPDGQLAPRPTAPLQVAGYEAGFLQRPTPLTRMASMTHERCN